MPSDINNSTLLPSHITTFKFTSYAIHNLHSTWFQIESGLVENSPPELEKSEKKVSSRNRDTANIYSKLTWCITKKSCERLPQATWIFSFRLNSSEFRSCNHLHGLRDFLNIPYTLHTVADCRFATSPLIFYFQNIWVQLKVRRLKSEANN